MNKKETLEFVFNGLEEQFRELGIRVTTAENKEIEAIAQERRATADTLINVKNLIDELEEEETKSKLREIASAAVQGDINLDYITTDKLIKELLERSVAEDFIKKWTKPLVEYLRAKHTPYTQIIITTEGVRVTEDIEGIPYSTVG